MICSVYRILDFKIRINNLVAFIEHGDDTAKVYYSHNISELKYTEPLLHIYVLNKFKYEIFASLNVECKMEKTVSVLKRLCDLICTCQDHSCLFVLCCLTSDKTTDFYKSLNISVLCRLVLICDMIAY